MAKKTTKTTTVPTPDYEMVISKKGVTVQAHRVGETFTVIVNGLETIKDIEGLSAFAGMVDDLTEAMHTEYILESDDDIDCDCDCCTFGCGCADCIE